jgi:hypothetical protein
MLEAIKKKKENIVEYLLYMWQIEDLLRACAFESSKVEQLLVSQYDAPPDARYEIREWYAALSTMMREDGVEERGHVHILNTVVAELQSLHTELTKSNEVYNALYYKALPSIVQLRSKSGGVPLSDIETCLTAIYGYVTLKMRGKPISTGTEEGVKQISSLLAFLAAKYREDV